MSKKTIKAETEAVTAEVKTEEAPQVMETLYPFEDFYAHPESIGSTKDLVWAAFHYNGFVGAATKEQAKKMVKEFAERKVES